MCGPMLIALPTMRITLLGEKHTNPIANIGLGMLKNISNGGIALGADLRHRLNTDDNSVAGEDRFNDWVATQSA